MSALKRNSNFELLRIFSMFMIVLHHCMVHGIFPFWHQNNTPLEEINNWFCLFLSSGGKIGVSLFILLTGYFTCLKEFSFEKWINVYLRMFVISALIGCGAYFFCELPGVFNPLKSFMPLTYEAYWFVSSWLLLYLFSPVLNWVLTHEKQLHLSFYMLVLGVIWAVIPSVAETKITCSSLMYFGYLYLLGGSLRLKIIVLNKKNICFLMCAAAVCLYAAGTTIIDEKEIFLNQAFRYFNLNRIYTLALSLSLFYLFANWEIKQNKYINNFSASMFGVYLIHDNDIIRSYLWNVWLRVSEYMTSPYFIFKALGISVFVLICCVFIDKGISLILGKSIQNVSVRSNHIFKSYISKVNLTYLNCQKITGIYTILPALFLAFVLFKPFLSGRYFVLSFVSSSKDPYQVNLSIEEDKFNSHLKQITFDVLPEQKNVLFKLPVNKIYGLNFEVNTTSQKPDISHIYLKGRENVQLFEEDNNADQFLPNRENLQMKFYQHLNLKGKKYYNYPLISVFLSVVCLIIFHKKLFNIAK